MPTYAYRCKICAHEFEELQRISDEILLQCPSCHAKALIRIIGGGAGLVFKGSGFYLTDYKKSPKSEGMKADGSKEAKADVKADSASSGSAPTKKSGNSTPSAGT